MLPPPVCLPPSTAPRLLRLLPVRGVPAGLRGRRVHLALPVRLAQGGAADARPSGLQQGQATQPAAQPLARQAARTDILRHRALGRVLFL